MSMCVRSLAQLHLVKALMISIINRQAQLAGYGYYRLPQPIIKGSTSEHHFSEIMESLSGSCDLDLEYKDYYSLPLEPCTKALREIFPLK